MKLLEGNTIRLRALEPEDLDCLYKWENDTSLWRYGSSLAPYSRFSLRDYIVDSRLDIFQSRQLRMMIVLKENEQPVGTVDLYDIDPLNGRAGIGILVDNPYRKQGVGMEALGIMQEYAIKFLMMKQIYAYVPERNEASVKLFANSNYEKTGKLKSWIKNGNCYEDVFFMQLLTS
ncbi:MAG: GNAT family N-acetyltransferase [Tannerella sp.]|jgi:diamine N-acetyltransferase|nr:GNAT family N-acetyltransferase [Tannerella sp.]